MKMKLFNAEIEEKSVWDGKKRKMPKVTLSIIYKLLICSHTY